MDWPIVVLLIVVIGAVTSLMQARIAAGRGGDRGDAPAVNDADRHRVDDEVRALKERVAVLEPIATDRNQLLEQQFEQLRDR